MADKSKLRAQDPFTDNEGAEFDWIADTQTKLPRGIILSDIHQVAPEQLHSNKLNRKLFKIRS